MTPMERLFGKELQDSVMALRLLLLQPIISETYIWRVLILILLTWTVLFYQISMLGTLHLLQNSTPLVMWFGLRALGEILPLKVGVVLQMQMKMFMLLETLWALS